MEEGLLIFIILLLIFGAGEGDIIFTDRDRDDVSVERDKVTGNRDIEITRYGNHEIYKVFRGAVEGNPTINLKTEDGDIYVNFEEIIAGNADINIESETGDIVVKFKEKITGNVNIKIKNFLGEIHVTFAEKITGNPRIILENSRGKVVFNNRRKVIKKYDILIRANKVIYKY